MPPIVGQLVAFLTNHWDLVVAIIQAIESGASKESLLAAVRAAQIEASDSVMREELGG